MSKTKIAMAILLAVGIIALILGAAIGTYWEIKEEFYFESPLGRSAIRPIIVFPNARIGFAIMGIGGLLSIAAASIGLFTRPKSGESITETRQRP